MKISTRFPIAVHILAALEYPPNKDYNTSETLAHSVNTNPVCIRRIIGQLKKAGLVLSRPGVAGTALARRPEEITLLDVFNAVDVVESLFGLHKNPNLRCIVGANIQDEWRFPVQCAGRHGARASEGDHGRRYAEDRPKTEKSRFEDAKPPSRMTGRLFLPADRQNGKNQGRVQWQSGRPICSAA